MKRSESTAEERWARFVLAMFMAAFALTILADMAGFIQISDASTGGAAWIGDLIGLVTSVAAMRWNYRRSLRATATR